MQIPKIDISGINDKEFSKTLLQDFYHAYSKYGFGYIINHGIEKPLIDQLFQVSKDFHSQPLSDKMKVKLNQNHRGYIAINTSTDVNSKLAEVKKPNQSSSFMMMRESENKSDEYLSGPNQWPKILGFRETLNTYTEQMSALGQSLISIAAQACSASPDELLPAFKLPTIWLRLLHYPPSPVLSPNDLYGSAPHTDFGALTLLAQDGIGGLQVQTPLGNWIDVPKIEGTFVVNIADMLNRLSNGFLKSTP